MSTLVHWAKKMREIFLGGTTSQFILYGNVFDLVPSRKDKDDMEFVSLRHYLEETLFAPFEVVIFYDRGKGVRVKKGMEEFQKYLSIYDSFNQTNYATFPGQIPRDPKRALELMDRFIQVGLQRIQFVNAAREAPEKSEKKSVPNPLKIAVVIDYAQYVAPRGDLMQLLGDTSEILIKILDWGSDPSIMGANIVTCLISENLNDLNKLIVESPYNAKLKISMPGDEEITEYVESLKKHFPEFPQYCKVPNEALSQKLLGLTRVGIRSLVSLAVNNKHEITPEFLSKNKKEMIEKECNELLEFIESPYTLDMVAGHREAKNWLREDAQLIKTGKTRSVPMGYLFTGGIGTGKTYLATCWAGDLGIPFVKFKNFRDKWQGATEGNLEKIFNVLDALGQVVVFIDEADQATGKRDSGGGDAGVSGRVYSMLAQKMSDTRNRGKIIWILATSRPDLLEVDLKRQGRLDVHIPLFAPQDDGERNELFKVVAKKLGVELSEDRLPRLPPGVELGGNEMEALLVRANRVYDLQKEGEEKKPLDEIVALIGKDFRPSPHTKALEYMDLVAVKECTDSRFLPAKYRKTPNEEIDARLMELKRQIH
ncbi:MAG: ATP-binding protein [Candidatus Eremiobacteraeota bacterium]|nr:ATP-binding protein [Candidatus Eremiobacteraeota bacterium]